METALKLAFVTLLCASMLIGVSFLIPPLSHAGNSFVVPQFKLQDPAGAEHSNEALTKTGAVLIVTIPNVKHGDLQGKWSRDLTKKGWPENYPRLVFLEDISQSSEAIRGRAIKSMKDKYKPGASTLLLMDMTGDVRRNFQIQNDETVLLIVDKNGNVIHAEEEEPSDEGVARVLKIAASMK